MTTTRSSTAIILLVSVAILAGGIQAIRLLSGKRAALDFSQYYVASRMMLDGDKDFIYSRDLPYFERASKYGADLNGVVMTNAYPPFTAVFMLPFALLPFDVSQWVFLCVNIALMIAGLYLFIPSGVEQRREIVLMALALTLMFSPLYQSLYLGQINCLLFFLCSLSLSLSKTGRQYAAGFLLAIAGLLKLFPFGLLLFFAFRKNYKLIASCLIFAIGLSIVTMPAIGVSNYVRFVFEVLPRESAGGAYLQNQGLSGVFLRAFTQNTFATPIFEQPLLARLLTVVFSLAASAILILVTFPKERASTLNAAADDFQNDLAFSLFFACFLLVLPKSWPHYGVFLLFGFVTMLRLVWFTRVLTQADLWLFAVSFVVWAFVPVTGWAEYVYGGRVLQQASYALKCLATALLFGVLTHLLLTLRQKPLRLRR